MIIKVSKGKNMSVLKSMNNLLIDFLIIEDRKE